LISEPALDFSNSSATSSKPESGPSCSHSGPSGQEYVTRATDTFQSTITNDMNAFEGLDVDPTNDIWGYPPDIYNTMHDVRNSSPSLFNMDNFWGLQTEEHFAGGYQSRLPVGSNAGPPVLDAAWQPLVEQLGFSSLFPAPWLLHFMVCSRRCP